MRGSLRLLRPHAGKHRSVLGVAALSTVLLAAAEVARPFPLKLVIDRLFEGRAETGPLVIDRLFEGNEEPGAFALRQDDLYLLAAVGGLVLLIAMVDAVASYAMEIRLRRVGESVAHSLRLAVYTHLQRLSLPFHERRQHGDLVTRTTGDVHAVGQLFSESLGAVASSALLLVGMLVVSFLIDPVLALVAFSVAPILGFATFHFRRRVKAAAKLQRAKEGEIASVATEALAAVREVKALGSEEFERERLARKSAERREAGLRAARIESRFAGLADVLGAFGAALVLVVGVFRVAAGAISPGDLVVMVSYARRVHRPLRDLARQAGRISRAMARADRVAEILATDEVLVERPDAYAGPRARGELELDRVAFAYAPGRHVLRGATLRVAAGEKVALVGRSGAGKSTIAALLARFYDPAEGRVLLDGRDVRDCSLAWLRDQVGLVLQDTVLFTGTVADNIAYGTDASRDDVVWAARAAGAHGFVSALPDGYDTELGARGVALSGGQRQRLAIARTLLRNPPVLVLDEPTAALDAASEAEVLDGLRALVEGRTTIIIAHSPALAAWADRRIVLKEGAIDEPPLAPVEADVAPRARRPAASESALRDRALPALPQLLDAAAMAPVLRRTLAEDAPEPRVAVRYLRYKPGTNLVVEYGVELGAEHHLATAMIAARAYLGRRARKPESVALANLVDGRSPALSPLAFDDELGCLVQWLPLDLALPGLAEPPDSLCRRLRDVGVPVDGRRERPVLLAYKPRRRAVIRLSGHVIKCYAKDEHYRAAVEGLRASSSLRDVVVPRFAGADAGLRVSAQPHLAGSAAGPEELAEPAGELLSVLHEQGGLPSLDRLAPAPPSRQLEAAAASAGLVAAIAPGLEPRLARLLERLAGTAPDAPRLVPSHGDFNARQLLTTEAGLAVTDFDELCLAPRALDLATYASYVLRDGVSELEAAEAVLDRVAGAYGQRPVGLDWYLATMLLRRAPRPFRYLEANWPDGVERMVRAAERAVAA